MSAETKETTQTTTERYEPGAIEAKWQERWNADGLFRTRDGADKPKFYYLDMFPYPSGDLHVGHVRNYAIGDAVARYHVMRGASVLHPMGWDAFGLPAENAAIKNQVHPVEWTERCINRMHEQFGKLGISFDWDREITTCYPDYYKWTQWLFLQFYKRGLAVRREATVNWCPVDQTVLANEQVKDGVCERCGTPVEQKSLTQWFFKITDYAQRLLDDLDTLPDWPERVIAMQRNWIGRSEGVTFRFALKDNPEQSIEVFTTRVDTVYGVTYMVLAPDHSLVAQLVRGTEYERQAEEFRNRVARQKDEQRDGRLEEIPKEGLFVGAYCVNPMTGEDVPIWLANYVVSEYGTGAVMAVPAHDQRDYEFARAYGLPIKVVITPEDEGIEGEDVDMLVEDAAYIEPGVMVNSGPFNGLPSTDGKVKVAEYMEAHGIGRRTVNYRLRDWCLSRQRYWGCPIPIIYCEDGTIEPVPEDQLPVLLPTDVKFTGTGGNPLLHSESFINTVDAQGRPARRETDTMDTFVDSSWYFLRFCSPHAGDVAFRREDVARWMPVDQYVGGIEHATMHLIYARFFTKVLYDMGLCPVSEPFPRLFTQGMVTMFSPTEGKVLKMSKSKGNVVSLDDAVARYGADATRMMTLFLGPPELDAEWTDQSEQTFAGIYRFLERVWRMTQARPFEREWRVGLDHGTLHATDMKLARKTHQTIFKVQSDIERFQLNTAISALMEHTNTLSEWLNHTKDAAAGGTPSAVYSEAVESLLLCLAPFAPHLVDELLERLGFAGSAYEMPWPQGREEVAREEEIVMPVQVNGKLRARLTVPAGCDEDTLRRLALESSEVQSHLDGKEPRRVIVVPQRMVNIVV